MIARLRLLVLRVILKVLWSIGGGADTVDGLPRITSDGLRALLGVLKPGDLVLLGNNGGLSHVAVFTGEGRIVHAMATEKTMRGWFGSLWDALGRATGAAERHVGVLEEDLAGFVDRYERDTYAVLRDEALDGAAVRRGVDAVEHLVGAPYDYGFSVGNEAWYCTEVALRFLEAARGAPVTAPTRSVRVPILLDAAVVEPVALFDVPGLRAVAVNPAARNLFDDRITGATVLS